MLEGARAALAQGVVAFVVLAALQRAWKVRDPALRLRFDLLALLAPTAGHLLVELACPWRGNPETALSRTLLRTEAWADVSVFGWRLDLVVLGAAAVLGGLALARDLFASARRPPGRGDGTPAQHARVYSRLQQLVDPAGEAPRAVVTVSPEALVFCTGFFRPRLVVTTAALDLLTDPELDAALAHELAHLRAGDTRTGWGLLLLRALAFWHPAAQVAGRRAAWELERRADVAAARQCGEDVLRAAHDRLGVERDLGHTNPEPRPELLAAVAGLTVVLLMAVVT